MCPDAQRSGVTAESVKAATKARQMTLEEAEKILGIDSSMGYDQVLKVRRYCYRNIKQATSHCTECSLHW